MSEAASGEAFTMGLMTMIGPVVDTVDASVKEVFDSQVGSSWSDNITILLLAL